MRTMVNAAMVNAAVVAVLCVAPAPAVAAAAEEGDPATGSLQVVGSVLEFRASDGVANDVETWRLNATQMAVIDIGPLDARGRSACPVWTTTSRTWSPATSPG
ncbi:hypothetical protein [Saccharothrix sp. Mg75]|uniref:hypothetical protein n=1 Tax=Saccharothrix sp. Mg75 TaxID=3445357 RepID=UPI003EEF3265